MFDIEKATRVYTGKDNHCRCGCGGRYFEKGSVGFTRAMNNYKKRVHNNDYIKIEGDSNYEYLNMSLENNKAITFYC